MNEKDLLPITRGIKHLRLLTTSGLIGLMISPSVYAADGSSSGIPIWVWILVAVAILVGVILLPKLKGSSKDKTLGNKIQTPTPAAKAPVAKAPVTEAKPQPTKVVEAPAVKPATEAVAEPTPAPIIKSTPQAEAVKETPVEKPAVLDALDEAKQLLAQQRFPQAVGVLNKGLQKDPNRSDLMLELLDIYLKQRDHEAFDTQLEKLKQLDDPFALIQAEELHRQLDRPAVEEDSDAIEFDSSKAIAPEPEAAAPVHDYTADSLDFTPTKTQPQTATPEVDHVATESATITPTEHHFSFDDIDLQSAVPAEQGSNEKTSDKSDLADFDFSAFDLKEPEAPQSKVIDTAPVVPKQESATLAVEPEIQPATTHEVEPLVDLDFNFDDSFSLDEEKQEVVKSEKDNLASASNEGLAAPTAAPTLGDIIKGDDLSSLEEEFPFLQSVDTFQTRLDLARSYISLGEIDSARELLNEVAEQGGSTQQAEARELIAKLAS